MASLPIPYRAAPIQRLRLPYANDEFGIYSEPIQRVPSPAPQVAVPRLPVPNAAGRAVYQNVSRGRQVHPLTRGRFFDEPLRETITTFGEREPREEVVRPSLEPRPPQSRALQNYLERPSSVPRVPPPEPYQTPPGLRGETLPGLEYGPALYSREGIREAEEANRRPALQPTTQTKGQAPRLGPSGPGVGPPMGRSVPTMEPRVPSVFRYLEERQPGEVPEDVESRKTEEATLTAGKRRKALEDIQPVSRAEARTEYNSLMAEARRRKEGKANELGEPDPRPLEEILQEVATEEGLDIEGLNRIRLEGLPRLGGQRRSTTETGKVWSKSRWLKANPDGDISAAEAEATKQGYTVIE